MPSGVARSRIALVLYDIVTVLLMAAFKAFFAVLAICSWAESGHAATPSSCAVGLKPGNYAIKGSLSTDGVMGNFGIAPSGFVNLPGQTVLHGIDVSKWQDATDFVQLKQCGGSFVFVRVSVGENPDNELEYKTHWANARNLNLAVGPYHYLTLNIPKPSSQQGEAVFAAAVDDNVRSARVQARIFLNRFGYLLQKDPLADVSPGKLGKPHLPPVLDMSERPRTSPQGMTLEALGKIYGAAACAWIDEFRKHPSFASEPVMIFTSAQTFADYNLDQAPCDLRGNAIWISNKTRDGSRTSFAGPDKDEPALYGKMCAAPDGRDRCVFQQYTSFGGFALYRPNAPLDLDRFYGSSADLAALMSTAAHPEAWRTYGDQP